MRKLVLICLLVLLKSAGGQADTVRLESRSLRVEVNDVTGRWALLDKRSGTMWPSRGTAGSGTATWLEGNFVRTETTDKNSVRLRKKNGSTELAEVATAVVFALADEGKAFEIRYEGKPVASWLRQAWHDGADRSVRVLDDALAITDIEGC